MAQTGSMREALPARLVRLPMNQAGSVTAAPGIQDRLVQVAGIL
jgi:hypothetical protein